MNRKEKWARYLQRIAVGLGFLAAAAVVGLNEAETAKMQYDTEMVKLIGQLNDYAKAKRADFGLLSNGGSPLYLSDDGNTPQNVAHLLQSLDGHLVESVFYGDDMEDGKETPAESSDYFRKTLAVPQQAGMPVFNIDYVTSAKQAEESGRKNRKRGYVSWASMHRQLDYLPAEPPDNRNAASCNSLKDVRNFLVLLNPEHFSSKQDYLRQLEQSSYDLLIIDLYAEDRPLTSSDVERLKQKPQGGRRLVYAYMSVGEAEPYRPYWQASWEKNPPEWLETKNEDWDSYRVKYWHKDWKNLLYGNPEAYLDRIMQAGFDGVFLDVIDVYQFFQEHTST